MSEENKAVVRRFLEELFSDLDRLGEVWDADLVWHGGSLGEVQGLDAYKGFLKALFTGFPDVRTRVEDIVAQGDRVAVRYTQEGTHTGPLMGIAPTGKTVTWNTTSFFRVAGGCAPDISSSLPPISPANFFCFLSASVRLASLSLSCGCPTSL